MMVTAGQWLRGRVARDPYLNYAFKGKLSKVINEFYGGIKEESHQE